MLINHFYIRSLAGLLVLPVLSVAEGSEVEGGAKLILYIELIQLPKKIK